MISVVAADDHPLILEGLERLLAEDGEFELRAMCTDGAGALEAIRRLQPDIAVLDLRMPGLSGLEVVRGIRSAGLSTRAVLLTGTICEADVLEAVRIGVDGVVLKEMPPRLLLQCLRKVHGGGRWIETRTAQRALEGFIRREQGERLAADLLTAREIEVVRMVAQGLRNKQIARELDISEGTVKSHLRNIYRKLDADNRISVRVQAERLGLM